MTAQESAALATNAQRKQLKFMAMAAHEPRKPLTPQRIAAGLLINRSAAGEIPIERLQVIIDNQITHLTRLVEDLLEGCRLSTGKLRISCKELNLIGILDQVVASCRPGVDSRKQYSSMHAPSEPVRMRGDPMRLTQVFNNLLDNAGKYTQESGEIALDLIELDSHAVITVSDNGIGIPAEGYRRSSNCLCRTRVRCRTPMAAWGSAWRWCANWWKPMAAAWLRIVPGAAMAVNSW